jgi:hypothetical protein
MLRVLITNGLIVNQSYTFYNLILGRRRYDAAQQSAVRRGGGRVQKTDEPAAQAEEIGFRLHRASHRVSTVRMFLKRLTVRRSSENRRTSQGKQAFYFSEFPINFKNILNLLNLCTVPEQRQVS